MGLPTEPGSFATPRTCATCDLAVACSVACADTECRLYFRDQVTGRLVERACRVSAPIVSLWRSRYQCDGLAGLHGELRPGRPRKHGDDKVAALLRTVLRSKPEVATHWTVRSAAAKTGISKSTVGRYFA